MRSFLFCVLCLASWLAAAQAFEPVVPGHRLEFPRDFGAHPGHRIEWWYATGQLNSPRGPLGFQVTFFRLRNRDAEANPSRFSPRQVIFAHAALADPGRGRFLHDQRVGRLYPGLVDSAAGDTDVRLDDWSLKRESGVYRTRVAADGFALELTFAPTQPVLLQGDGGYSRKGPLPGQASYYYSEPQLKVEGRVITGSESVAVTGTAWLDHEWSSELLPADATGWDWLGANLDDGGALMAFRVRGKDGSTKWAAATFRGPPVAGIGSPAPAVKIFGPADVRFTVRREWQSPRSGTVYPVEMEIRVGESVWRVEPLMDDQELDARASTGTLYWEGAVKVAGPGGIAGRGYLELTGYAERVPF
jgi:predicted secreted hydrolase